MSISKKSSKKQHVGVWKLQDAKARFSELIRACRRKPQIVSVRGEEEAVVISRNEYDLLSGKKPSFIEFVNSSPFKGLELNIKRDKSTGREVDL